MRQWHVGASTAISTSVAILNVFRTEQPFLWYTFKQWPRNSTRYVSGDKRG
jgi:hypothetical protein